jgi:hypothetical protein
MVKAWLLYLNLKALVSKAFPFCRHLRGFLCNNALLGAGGWGGGVYYFHGVSEPGSSSVCFQSPVRILIRIYMYFGIFFVFLG